MTSYKLYNFHAQWFKIILYLNLSEPKKHFFRDIRHSRNRVRKTEHFNVVLFNFGNYISTVNVT